MIVINNDDIINKWDISTGLRFDLLGQFSLVSYLFKILHARRYVPIRQNCPQLLQHRVCPYN